MGVGVQELSEAEIKRHAQVRVFVTSLLDLYGLEDEKRAEMHRAWTSELIETGRLDSVDWKRLKRVAHKRAMLREYGERYAEYQRLVTPEN